MGPTWNPARKQKTGLWENGEGAGVGTNVVFQKDVLIWPLHPVSGLPTCGRAPQYSTAGQEDSIWSAPTWQVCLWSLKSVNVFPRPLGTWMSLQAKSHGVGGIQGMTLHKVKSSLLYMSFKLHFQSLWDFSWRRARLQFPFLTHFLPMPIKLCLHSWSHFFSCQLLAISVTVESRANNPAFLSYLEASKLWSIGQKLCMLCHAPKCGGRHVFFKGCLPVQSFLLPDPTPQSHPETPSSSAWCALTGSLFTKDLLP